MKESSIIEITPGAAPVEFTESEEWWQDLKKAYDLLCHDRPSKPADILYFFGRSYFDAPKEGVYRLAVNLYQEGMVKKIIIPGTEGERLDSNIPRESHPGKTLMKDRLVKMGVPAEDVVFSGPAYHTRQESDAFLKYSMEHDLHNAIAVTNPTQIVRAIGSLVAKIDSDHLPVNVFAAVPDPVTFDWGRMVKGSQGAGRKPAYKHLFQEFDGIHKYQNFPPPNNAATFSKLFEYIEARDTGEISKRLWVPGLG